MTTRTLHVSVIRDARRQLEAAARRLRKVEDAADGPASEENFDLLREALVNIDAAVARIDIRGFRRDDLQLGR